MNGPGPGALHVLIIDDSPHDRADAKAALRRGSARQLHFSEAASGELGLQRCLQQPAPDCVLLDLGLPDVDDMEVLARLPRDGDGLLQLPVVVLTGSVEPGRNQAVLRAGAQDYVGKAWLSPETLTKAVENAIERLNLTRGMHAQRRLAADAQRTSQRLEAENRRMAELNRLKTQFLATMSHELRTPLAAIIGFSDLLHHDRVPPGSDQHRRFQGHINSSARHLLRLVDDVLDLSRFEAGQLHFFPEELVLEQVVREVADILGVEVLRKRIDLAIDIQPLPGTVFMDATRLRQVVFNLLSNAIKFTPDGGKVSLRAAPQGDDRVRIEIEDEGIGIAADDIPRLFIEFQQLETGHGKRFAGVGLGLALTRRLVEAQGGTVGVSSQPQQGSTFWLVLDRVQRSGLTPGPPPDRPPR